MIVEHGIIAAHYQATASVEEAIAGAGSEHAVAWIGAVDVTAAEVQDMSARLGLGRRAWVEIQQHRQSPRVARAHITAFSHGVHLRMLGVDTQPTETGELVGEFELIATNECVAIMASGVSESMRPSAIRGRLEPALADFDKLNGGLVMSLVIAQILDAYEDLLDGIEDESEQLSERVFARRNAGQLKRIYALSRPLHAASVAMQPLVTGLDHLDPAGGLGLDLEITRQLRSELVHLAGRLDRIDALLSSARESYFNLAQDEANRLMEQQGDVTRRLSGYALLIAIPTIVFSLYGTNFNHIPLIDQDWGYGVMFGLTVVLCLVAWWRLRKADWI